MIKEGIGNIVIGAISLVVMAGGIFIFGKFDNHVLSTIGKERANIKTEIFQESKSYVEGMISDLASYKREFERTDDVQEKEQIANIIDSEFANFDINKIDNASLYNFLLDIRKGEWK